MVSTAALASDSRFERTLNVSAQPDLYVSTGSGDITIHAGNDTQIHIIGHVHAGWAILGNVQDRIQRILNNPPIAQEGNTIRVGESNDRGLFNNISIDYDISVPTAVALNLHSGSGDIVVNQVGRYLSASSGSGDLRAHGINGPAELGTGSGDIELEQDAPGDVKAKTGSGTVKIRGLNGSLTARSGSGDIQADGRLVGGGNLASGSGTIKLRLPPDARFNLEASTGSGDIHVNFPGAPRQGDASRHHLTASINGGGATIEARTGSGDIEIDNH
jgi:DUF4097 and DUF4098 domain-containing protein YvlB